MDVTFTAGPNPHRRQILETQALMRQPWLAELINIAAEGLFERNGSNLTDWEDISESSKEAWRSDIEMVLHDVLVPILSHGHRAEYAVTGDAGEGYSRDYRWVFGDPKFAPQPDSRGFPDPEFQAIGLHRALRLMGGKIQKRYVRETEWLDYDPLAIEEGVSPA